MEKKSLSLKLQKHDNRADTARMKAKKGGRGVKEKRRSKK